MTARAWPYAVSRGATSGYQAIVVPGFLADAEQAYILEYASRQETSEPGVVTVRDVVGAIEEPLSLVYRAPIATGSAARIRWKIARAAPSGPSRDW
jgi:hypothetical protein